MNDSTRASRRTRRSRITPATFFQALAVIGIALAAGFIVLTTWEGFTGSELSDPVPVTFPADEVGIELPARVEVVEVRAQLTGQAGLGWRALWGAMHAIPAGLVIAALWVLYRVRPIEMELQESRGLDVLDYEFGLQSIPIAVLAWAFADIWRRGVALRTERDLTI
jgi:hypothetical protein